MPRTSTPSMTMLPAAGSTMRYSASISVLLPQPVRPQMPILECAGTEKETWERTGGRSSR